MQAQKGGPSKKTAPNGKMCKPLKSLLETEDPHVPPKSRIDQAHRVGLGLIVHPGPSFRRQSWPRPSERRPGVGKPGKTARGKPTSTQVFGKSGHGGVGIHADLRSCPAGSHRACPRHSDFRFRRQPHPERKSDQLEMRPARQPTSYHQQHNRTRQAAADNGHAMLTIILPPSILAHFTVSRISEQFYARANEQRVVNAPKKVL